MNVQIPMATTLHGVVIGTTLLLLAPLAHADPEGEVEPATPQLATGLKLSLRVEPGLAVALTAPQSQATEAGFGQTLKLMFGISRYLEVGPTAAVTTLPAETSMPVAGTAWAFGGGARLMRPHDVVGGAAGAYAISPWVDADLLYVHNGSLDRPGFAIAAGLALPIDDARKFWVGPFVRYFQILQGDPAGLDNRDAKILQVGLSLDVGGGLERRHARPMVVTAEPAVVPLVPASDRDHDGVPDDSDNCPDMAGLPENAGCPVYKKLLVKADRLELQERIAFEWDSARLEQTSFPALNEVAQALLDNPKFRVQVDGHASSEGEEAHNQTLSEERATAVLDYLVSRGVAKDRLVSKGFSSSVPVATNSTEAGRETNRRVEFALAFTILKQ